MDEDNQSEFCSSSSLFASKHAPASSSSETFVSIFSPPSKILGTESFHCNNKEIEKKQEESKPQISFSKTEEPENEIGLQTRSQFNSVLDSIPRINEEDESKILQNRDMSSLFEDLSTQPCHLSSSIYYGGQDNIYFCSKSNQSLTFCDDVGEDDNSGMASRGNWWQESLYY